MEKLIVVVCEDDPTDMEVLRRVLLRNISISKVLGIMLLSIWRMSPSALNCLAAF